MKQIFAAYEHSTIGFPGVVLKWEIEHGRIDVARVVVNGIIKSNWSWHNLHPESFMNYECERFDKYVRKWFSDDSSVQG